MNKNLTLPIVEFGHVQLPAELRGRHGTLRGAGICSIAADDDIAAVNAWLAHCHSPHTLRAYRREVERLLLWAGSVRLKPLSSLMTEDYYAYNEFLKDPKPAERWCAPQRPRPLRAAVEWRPFAGPLLPKSRSYAMGVIKLLTTFLHQTGYFAINPMATFKLKRPDGKARTDRYLERELILAGFEAVEALPRDNEEAVHIYERARFLLRLLYGCGARPHEVILATMADLKVNEGRWWWYIVGKGEKERRVVVPAGLLEALKRYRRHRSLPPLPASVETAPLIVSVRGERPLGSTDALRKVMRTIFDAVQSTLPEDDPRQERLSKASTHWMRHTFATHTLDGGAKIKHVQDALGHASVATLSIYTHSEDRHLHADLSAQYDALVPP